tara:strand:+ start:80 stop:622 length:543 start_codon:yes stop_codon:yes gene_type:complete
MSGKVVIQDSPQVREFFKKIKPNCLKTLHLALRDTADAIEAEAINNLRKGYRKSTHGRDGGAYDRGLLAASMKGVVEENTYKFVAGSKSPYAAHVEYGTGPAAGRPAYRPPDGKLGPWSQAHGKEEDAVQQSIMRFGTQPRRFLGRAFATKKGILPKRFAKILARKLSMAAKKNITVTRR